MLAKEMKLNRKYKYNGAVYKTIEKRDDYYLVERLDNKGYYRMKYHYEVQHVFKGQDRVTAEQLGQLVEYIKANFWFLEKKAYIVFLKDTIKYKLLYGAQKVLVRKPLLDIEYEKKYANKYYAYKVALVKDFIMRRQDGDLSKGIL